MSKLSVNKLALKVVEQLIEEPELYGVKVEKLGCGATVIDTGLEAPGGIMAGLKVTEITMGGLAEVSLTYVEYGDLTLPTVVVSTDRPAVSLLGCQLAGWRVKVGDFTGDGSGPARALALKPKKVFKKIGYQDDYDSAVIVLETSKKPGDEVALFIGEKCDVEPKEVYMVLTSTTSYAGSTQISGRIAETGLFKMEYLGLDPNSVLHASGYAPVMPPHPDWGVAIGRCEDALTYGGFASYLVDVEDEGWLADLVSKTPSSSSPSYGKPSYEIYKEVDFDFTKIDPALFAPAGVAVTNVRTGRVFRAGGINAEILRLGLEI